jgi:hypothetical protein
MAMATHGWIIRTRGRDEEKENSITRTSPCPNRIRGKRVELEERHQKFSIRAEHPDRFHETESKEKTQDWKEENT